MYSAIYENVTTESYNWKMAAVARNRIVAFERWDTEVGRVLCPGWFSRLLLKHVHSLRVLCWLIRRGSSWESEENCGRVLSSLMTMAVG